MRSSVHAVQKLLLIVLLIVLPTSRAFAGLREQAAVQDLRAALGPGAVVMTDPAHGQLVALRGSEPVIAGGDRAVGDAVLRWCGVHAAALGLRPGADALELKRVETRRGGLQRVTLVQRYQGLPVVGGESRALVDARGALRGFASGVVPDLELDIMPTFAETQAIAAVKQALGPARASAQTTARLVILAADEGAALAWQVESPQAEGHVVRSWVDARTGAIRVLEDGVARSSGLVYMIDPRGAVTTVTLPGVRPGGGLHSDLLQVLDSVNPPAVPDERGDFLIGPEQAAFDQVNAYYHVSHFVQDIMIGHLGMSPLSDSLFVRVQFRTEPFVAFTSNNFIFLGQPIAGFVREVARSADIVIHEATHAVLYGHDIQPTSLRREAGALHEGLADYFAAAVTADPAIGEWLYLPFPDGTTRVDMPLPRWHASNYDKIGFAGGEAGSPWGNGMILSATLWDLRAELGESADSLVVESFDAMPSAPQWGHFANAMILADQLHHGGRFGAAIARVFTRRGLRGAIESAIAVVGPSTLTPGQSAQFSTTACCGGLPGVYEWRARNWCRGGPCGDFAVFATSPTVSLTPDADMELRVRVIGPWGDTLESAPHFVGVSIPQLAVEGPRRVQRYAPSTWSARITATGPAQVTWTRRYLTLGAALEDLGSRDELTFAPSAAFELVARLRDGLGRITSQTLFVDTFVPGTVPARIGALFSVTQVDAAGQVAQTRFELPAAGRLEASLFDIRGRLRAHIADVPAQAGGHAVRWDATALENGIYFLRTRLSGSGEHAERVAIVR